MRQYELQKPYLKGLTPTPLLPGEGNANISKPSSRTVNRYYCNYTLCNLAHSNQTSEYKTKKCR